MRTQWWRNVMVAFHISKLYLYLVVDMLRPAEVTEMCYISV